jgi:hypothetical protein
LENTMQNTPSVLNQFSPPADVVDFPSQPQLQEQMNAAWSANVNRWVNAALIGDVWDLVNYGPRPAFYNPLVTPTPAGAVNAAIPWNAFPGRIQALFPQQSGNWQQWADQGVPAADPVTIDLCSQQAIAPIPYPPTGPRGWQDEYCEWSVTRNAAGQITSVMFTCENPEYWLTLWNTDPGRVLQLYQSLVNPAVQLDDLSLTDADGRIVIDPTTGGPVYNPLNQWNSGTQTLSDRGGAVHLTSSPNTLGAEFDLAAAATMPRAVNGDPVTSPSQLVCCARYGKIGRHSDPTIGQNVNQTVNYTPQLPQARATLTNPPGLYMQMPDFSNYATPDGTPASQFWTIVRGKTRDPKVPGDIDRILHATFAVPAEKGYTVSDISIGGAKIQYGSQITGTITMALMATVFGNSGVTQTPVGCTVAAADSNVTPSVSAIQSFPVFAAYRQQEQASNELPLSIPILALGIRPGQSLGNIAVLLNTSEAPQGAVFTVPEGGVTITVDGTQALPDSGMTVYLATIAADPAATPGDRTVLAQVPGMPATTQAAIGLLTVTQPAGTPLAKGAAAGPKAAKPTFRRGRA